jgi:probable HAF family extracellular repeat protein
LAGSNIAAKSGGFNNHGQLIGISTLPGDQMADPFLWDGEKLIDLFTETAGGSPTTANAINDAGEVVGNATFPNGASDAYVWKNGVAIDLGTLPGDCFSEAWATNFRGQVVGQSFSCASDTVRTFLWENGLIFDLNALIPGNSSLQLTEVFDINDRGEIAGVGVPPGCPNLDDAACGHAFVLIPCQGEHSDDEGCAEHDEDAAAAIPDRPAALPNTAAAADTGLTPREITAWIRMRFARHRGSGAWPQK